MAILVGRINPRSYKLGSFLAAILDQGGQTDDILRSEFFNAPTTAAPIPTYFFLALIEQD